MNFMGPYILAMREQAPKMFMELRRSGKLEQFARERALEGNALAEQMLARRPKDARGQPSQADKREVEEIVLAQLLEFEPEGKVENPEPPPPNPLRKLTMPFNRQTVLRQWARAQAGANNQALPQNIQNLYQQAADHGQVALGMSNALEKKTQQDLFWQRWQEEWERKRERRRRMRARFEGIVTVCGGAVLVGWIIGIWFWPLPSIGSTVGLLMIAAGGAIWAWAQRDMPNRAAGASLNWRENPPDVSGNGYGGDEY